MSYHYNRLQDLNHLRDECPQLDPGITNEIDGLRSEWNDSVAPDIGRIAVDGFFG